MKQKGILKFKGAESKGAMHFIMYEGKRVSITLSTSRKVKHIKANGSIGIAPNLLSRKFEDKKIKIIDDKETVRSVFDYMTNAKHIYYKNFDENLVVLEYLT